MAPGGNRRGVRRKSKGITRKFDGNSKELESGTRMAGLSNQEVRVSSIDTFDAAIYINLIRIQMILVPF